MCMKWKELMNKLIGRPSEDVACNRIEKAEANTALSALDEVGCVSVSESTAEELGAFEESAVSLDDVLEDQQSDRSE